MYRMETHIQINSIISSLIVKDINILAWVGFQQNVKFQTKIHGTSNQIFTSFNTMIC